MVKGFCLFKNIHIFLNIIECGLTLQPLITQYFGFCFHSQYRIETDTAKFPTSGVLGLRR